MLYTINYVDSVFQKTNINYLILAKVILMVGILQFFVAVLILVSFALVVAVPVILATPGEWEKSQGIVWSGAGLWSALVILTGIFNVVPA
jgi:photosystem II PsbZ protein